MATPVPFFHKAALTFLHPFLSISEFRIFVAKSHDHCFCSFFRADKVLGAFWPEAIALLGAPCFEIARALFSRSENTALDFSNFLLLFRTKMYSTVPIASFK